jgi:plastocyanin
MVKKIILIILALGALAACGGDDNNDADDNVAGVGSETTINVTMHDIYYGDANNNIENPPVWTVNTEDSVTVQADNMGGLQHNWAIVKPDVTLPDTIADPTAVEDLLLYDIGELPADETDSDVFTAPAPGQYTVICTVAGHYPFMQGRLVVEE